jgi:hypothetical protein
MKWVLKIQNPQVSGPNFYQAANSLVLDLGGRSLNYGNIPMHLLISENNIERFFQIMIDQFRK